MKVPRVSPLSRPHDFPPLAISDAESIAQARQVLTRACYTKSHISKALGLQTPGEPIQAANLLHLSRHCGGSPLETLINLFVLGQSVPMDVVQQALTPMRLEEWQALGLLRADDSAAVASYELHAGEDLIVALPAPSTRRPPSRETLELHRQLQKRGTWLLDDLTIRRPGTATLNVATGCGIHALLAAAHSTEVMAVDSNPRAVELASFNAALNGLHHVECHAGEASEVSSGRAFDLIVCDPSVAIAPLPLTAMRTRSLPGDGTYEALVRGLPRSLRQGGYAQILIHWAHLRGEADQDRVRQWVAGAGCDAWLLRFNTQDPASYALEWLPEPPDENLAPFALRLDAWLVYYAQQGIEAISSGLLTLRARSTKSNWFHCEDLPDCVGPCGQALLCGFQNRTFLSGSADDDSFLEVRLRVAPEARWEKHTQLGAERSSVIVSQLRLPEGLLRTLEVDENVMEFLNRCRGQQTLRNILAELAASLQQDLAVVMSEGTQLARVLLDQGFVSAVEESEVVSSPGEQGLAVT